MQGAHEAQDELDRLKEEVLRDAAQKRAEVTAKVPLALKARDGLCFNWLEVKDRLKQAAEHATAMTPPALERFHGLRRRLAGWVAKIVLRLTRFITVRQMEYNVTLLDLVRDTAEALHDVEKRLVAQQELVRQLEATVVRLQMRRAA